MRNRPAHSLIFSLFLILMPFLLKAQVIPSETQPLPPDAKIGSYYSVLPIAGYTSDLGFFGGGYLQRINYDINMSPYLSMLRSDITFSTKGNITSQLNYERIFTFGLNVRSYIKFIGQREKQAHFFGIGNNSEFSADLFGEDYYFYENREIYLNYQGRKTLRTFGERGKIDVFGETAFWRVNAMAREDESIMQDAMPAGSGLNWVNKLGFGVIADSRDSEFSPTRGIRYEAGFNASRKFMASDFNFSEIHADLRHFYQLFGNVILAHNVQLKHNFGDTPFWALSKLGDEKGLRGYHRNRFRGDSAVMNILELRSWLLSILDDQLQVGVQLFWDTGRVFSEFDSNGFFNDWKQSYGIGGVVTLFNSNLILRGDLGFSDETFRVYFGTGYIF